MPQLLRESLAPNHPSTGRGHTCNPHSLACLHLLTKGVFWAKTLLPKAFAHNIAPLVHPKAAQWPELGFWFLCAPDFSGLTVFLSFLKIALQYTAIQGFQFSAPTRELKAHFLTGFKSKGPLNFDNPGKKQKTHLGHQLSLRLEGT